MILLSKQLPGFALTVVCHAEDEEDPVAALILKRCEDRVDGSGSDILCRLVRVQAGEPGSVLLG